MENKMNLTVVKGNTRTTFSNDIVYYIVWTAILESDKDRENVYFSGRSASIADTRVYLNRLSYPCCKDILNRLEMPGEMLPETTQAELKRCLHTGVRLIFSWGNNSIS